MFNVGLLACLNCECTFFIELVFYEFYIFIFCICWVFLDPGPYSGNVLQGSGYRNMGSGIPQVAATAGNISASPNMAEMMRRQNPHLLAQLQRSPSY